ncbi:IPT/TIG domain-containing protein [Nocardioides sp.]|uniref:IPT/TIG domain-containing protein n=1 Tax=Nocardioides sp. TaxID=35761 RepID=UPI0035B1EEEB
MATVAPGSPAWADPAPTVSITSVAPAVAAVGTTIDVAGTGFGSTPTDNTVTINGRPASVTSSSPDRLTVAVPTGATSGPVVVTTSSGSGTSPADVYVPPSPIVPADVEFTGRTGETPVTATVSTSGKVALLTFAADKDDRVALQLSSGTFGSSTSTARVSVLRPNGAALVTATGFGNAGLWLDTRTVPETGTYTVLVDPQGAATGQVTLRTFDVPTDTQVAAAPGGPAVVAATTVPGQNAAVTVSGAANQRVSVALSASTFGASTGNARVSVLKPDGSTLVSARGFATAGTFLDAFKLPVAGTYVVLVDPQLAVTGQVTVKVHDVGPDAVFEAATDGAAVTPATTTPGQNANVRFTGTAGQLVSAQLAASTYGSSTSSASVSILKPDGTALVTARGFGATGTFLDSVKLPTAGTYSMVVDPADTAVGQVEVRLFDASTVEASLAAGGDGVTTTTTVPGQNASLAFTGSSGSRVSLMLSSSTYGSSTSSAQVSVRRPDGTVLVSPRGFGTAGTFVDTFALPTAGTYTVLVDPQGALTGSVTSRLYAVPADATVAVATDGASNEVATSIPGQNGAATFNGVAGQRTSYLVKGSTYGASTSSASISVVRPDGTVLVTPRGLGSSDLFVDTVALTATGTHKVALDPASAAVGSARIQVFLVPDSARGSITPADGPRVVSTTVPGEDLELTLPADAGQRISLNLSESSITGANLTVLSPSGAVVVPAKTFGTSGTLVDFLASEAGVHRVLINPSGTNVGSVTLRAYDAAENEAVAVPGGDEVTVITSNPGQNAAVTFDGAAGQRVSIQLTDSTFGSSSGSATVAVRSPDGSTLRSSTGFGTSGVFLDTLTLPVAGTYRIVIDPQGTNTGQVDATVNDVPADPVATTTPGGDTARITTTVPGQNGTVTFDATTGQRVSIELTGATFGTSSSSARVSLLRPDGTALVTATNFSNSGTFIDTKTLPTTGTYTLLIDPQGTNTGQVDATVNDVPADPVATTTPGGDTARITTTVPGQNGTVTFDATTGQRVSIELTGATFGTSSSSARVSLLRPDGTALVTATNFSNSGTFIDTKTLPTTGTYTLLIDPQGTNTGQVDVTVNDVPTDPTHAIEVGGELVGVETAAAGQNVTLAATLTAGVAYRLRVDQSSGNAMIRVTGPAGQVVDSGERASAPDDVVTFTPASTGAHVIVVDPEGSVRGSWRLELYTRVGSPRFSVPSGSSEWVTDPVASLSWTTDVSGTVAGHAVRLDSSPTTDPGTTSTQADWSISQSLPDGESWAHVRTVLTTGEAGRPSHHRFRIDTTAPVVSDLTSPTHALPDRLGPAQATLSWSGSDATSGVSGYSYTMSRDRATAPDEVIDSTDATWNDTLDSDGDWVFTVKARDRAGHWSSSRSMTITVDDEGPGTPVLSSTTHPDEASAYASRTFVGRWTASDPTDLVDSWAVSITQDADSTPTEPGWETTRRATLDPGIWYLHVRAQDTQGRWSETAHRRIEVLATSALIAPVEGQLLWGDARITFSCTSGSSATVVATHAQTTTDLGPVTDVGDGTCRVDWPTGETNGADRRFPVGEYTLEVRPEDPDAGGASARVVVADSPSLTEALANHRAVGLLTAEDVTAYAYAAALAPSSLPEPYAQLVADGEGGDESLLRLLTDVSADLSPAQQALFDQLANPVVDSGGASSGARTSGGGSRTTALAAGCTGGGITIDLPRIPEITLACIHRTDHFVLFYNESAVGGPGPGGSTPTMIVEHGDSLERAYDEYGRLGFRRPDHDIPVYYSPFMGSSGFTPGEFILMGPQGGATDKYLPMHEFFHVIQWQYINLGDYRLVSRPMDGGRNADNLWWWNEATANWAAMHAQPSFNFTQELDKYLARTDREFDQPTEQMPGLPINSPGGLGAEYGGFPFPLFLEQEHGVDAVESIFATVGDGVIPTPPTSAIEDLFADEGTSYETQIERFRWSTYVLEEQLGLGFPPAQVDSYWRPRLRGELPESRVPFEPHDIEHGDSIDGEVSLEASGSKFIEVTKPYGETGELTFTVSTDDQIKASALTTSIESVGNGDKRSTICDVPRRVDIEGDSGGVTLQLTDSCPTAVLHLISVERTKSNLFDDDASWSASFFSSGSTLRSGNVELGLNAYGGLINGGVGLRRTDIGQGEVLAHGCACEGWGIGNTAASAGSVVGGTSTNLLSTGFDFDGTSATSDTELVGGPMGLRIRHRFTPSSHPDLYRVEVDVVNTGFSTWQDVHYRRAFDWDVDPTPFHEYVTFGRRPGAADSYVHYTSNDGFADPNPANALTHLGSEGYFEDAGPADHGGLIDIALGDIVPDGGRRSFVFYYGVSLSESAALAAIDSVGAQVYSLGQPDGAASSGSPITAVFAVDGTDYSMPPVEALTGDDVAPRNRKPRSRPTPSKPVRGVLGDAPVQGAR